jgi:dUTP pyrophosphatase
MNLNDNKNLEEMVRAANESIENAKNSYESYMQSYFSNSTFNFSTKQTVKIYSQSGDVPEYKTMGSSGLDLCAFIDAPMTLKPMEIALIPTGIYVDIPDNYEFQIRARSGTAFKKGITLINCIGTIDDDYTDEIKIAVINLSGKEQIVEPKERIAQMVLMKVEKLLWEQVDSPEEFNSKDRTGGFGSTGTK